MLTMMQKRTDFAGWLEDLLQVHDSRFTVDTLERKELEQGMDRKTRLSVIPLPIRYAAMYETGVGAIGDGLDGAGNVCDYEGHTFTVHVFWGKTYAPTYAASSQSAFEAMVYNAVDAVKPGVLQTIRQGRNRSISSQEYHVGNPQGDAFTGITRGTWDFGDIAQPEFAHYLSFTVTLL